MCWWRGPQSGRNNNTSWSVTSLLYVTLCNRLKGFFTSLRVSVSLYDFISEAAVTEYWSFFCVFQVIKLLLCWDRPSQCVRGLCFPWMWQGFPWALFTLTNELPNCCAVVKQLLFGVFLQALMELKLKKKKQKSSSIGACVWAPEFMPLQTSDGSVLIIFFKQLHNAVKHEHTFCGESAALALFYFLNAMRVKGWGDGCLENWK